MTWLPSDLSGLAQWVLDQDQGAGHPYEAALVDGKPALRSLESYDSLRAPRGQRCWYFAGVDQHAVATVPTISAFPFSFSCWAKREDTDTRTILSIARQASTGQFFRLYYQSGANQVIADHAGTQLLPSSVLPTLAPGIWNHFIVSFISATEMALWINDTEDSQYRNDVSLVINTLLNRFVVGASRFVTPTQFMKGHVRDVRLYRKTLTANERTFIYTDGRQGDDPGLPAPWFAGNEETGLVGFDRNAGASNADLLNITQGTFHATDADVPTNPANEQGHTNRRNLLPHTTDITDGVSTQVNYNGWNAGHTSTVTPNVADPDGGNDAFTIQPGIVDFSMYVRQNLFPEPWVVQAQAGDRFLFTARASSPVNLVVDGSGVGKAAIGTDWTEIDATLGAGNVLLGGFGSWNGGEAITFYNLRWIRAAQIDDSYQEITSGIAAEGIVPRDESSPGNDVLGDPIQYPGQCPYLVQTQTPCGTFDGVGDKIVFVGNPWNSAADFSVSAWARLAASGNYPMILSGDLTGCEFRFLGATRQLEASGLANTVTVDGADALALNQWAFVCVNYRASDNRVQLFIDGELKAEGTIPDFATNVPNLQIGARGDLYWFGGSLADIRIHSTTIEDWSAVMAGGLSGSEVVVYPFTEGNGLTIHNVVANNDHGAASGIAQVSFWANRIDHARDHCLGYGGRTAAGAFIPGLLDGTSAADGNPITLLAKQHGNPYSRLIMDPWAAPKLAPLSLPAESAPGELLRQVAPLETKFRSEQNPSAGVDGTAFADGDNRVFNVEATLTGQDLSDALFYISRASAPPAFLAAWAVRANPVIQPPVMP